MRENLLNFIFTLRGEFPGTYSANKPLTKFNPNIVSDKMVSEYI